MLRFVVGVSLMFSMILLIVVQDKAKCPETELLVASLTNAQNALTKTNQDIAKNLLEKEKELNSSINEYEAKKKSLQCKKD